MIGAGKKGFAALLERSFIILFPFWLFEVSRHCLHLDVRILPTALETPLFVNPASQGIGVVVILIGISFFGLALLSFKSSWRVGIDTKAPGKLITTGIFAISRNPIFLSMDLYFLGTFLIRSNLFFLLAFVCLSAGMHLQILNEETFLVDQYGDAYRRYMAKVKRYIGLSGKVLEG